MSKTLTEGDKWTMGLRLFRGEVISLNCVVDAEGSLVARMDASTAVIRVYTVDSEIVGQYIDNYTVRAVVMRRELVFTQTDVAMMIALVLSVVEMMPGVDIVSKVVMDGLNFDTEPLF